MHSEYVLHGHGVFALLSVRFVNNIANERATFVDLVEVKKFQLS